MSIKNMRRLISVSLIIVLSVIFSILTDSFLSTRNIFQLLKDSAYVGLIAIGLSFVIIGGGIDLSGGGIVCLVGILVARFSFVSDNIPGIVVIFFGVICGMALGAINGFFVTKVNLSEFVTTLASGFVFSGFALIILFKEGGRLISRSLTLRSFLAFGLSFRGIYYITVVWVFIALFAYIVQSRTKFGLHVYSTGSNLKAAEMSGVNTVWIKTSGFIISGGCAGLAAAFVVAAQNATSASLGAGMEFQAIAANVVGGVVLGGGKGDAISALLGALFLTLLLNGIYKLGLGTPWQYMIQGIVIVVAITFDSLFNRLYQKRILAVC